MKLIDFFIGLTLMNAMPHFVLGIWRQPMLSGFGLGNVKNKIWGLVNFVISITLFLVEYGWDGLLANGMYAGALLVLIVFFFTSTFWRNKYLNP